MKLKPDVWTQLLQNKELISIVNGRPVFNSPKSNFQPGDEIICLYETAETFKIISVFEDKKVVDALPSYGSHRTFHMNSILKTNEITSLLKASRSSTTAIAKSNFDELLLEHIKSLGGSITEQQALEFNLLHKPNTKYTGYTIIYNLKCYLKKFEKSLKKEGSIYSLE